MPSATTLTKRQNNNDNGIFDNGDGFYSGDGYAIRYGITAAVIFAVLIYFVGGYLHGKARINKNKPLMAYHRWMFRTSARSHHSYANRPYYNPSSGAAFGGPGEGYQMHNTYQGQNAGVYRPPGNETAPPPPAYNADIPPAYVPGQGGKAPPYETVGPVEGEAGSSAIRPPGTAYQSDLPMYR